jgi:transformation/transcription domain-associated protein
MSPLQPHDRGEMAMWAEQWVNCAKQLNQWDILAEYARGIDNTSLQIDAMWRLREWEQLRNTVKEYRESVRSC